VDWNFNLSSKAKWGGCASFWFLYKKRGFEIQNFE